MFILHIALQGCLKSGDIEYGLTADTGGHIRYLLELVEASEQRAEITRLEIATRAFADEDLGAEYAQHEDALFGSAKIVRFPTTHPGYLAKEYLAPELPAFTQKLIEYLRSLPELPDMVHAHYADAGAVAAAVKEELGIPFLFTGHSLGMVKAAAMGEGAPDAQLLQQRIAIEDTAIAAADAIIASSRDEAEKQYLHYPSYDSGKIRVIAPGAQLEQFINAQTSADVQHSIDRFLDDPAKPMVLAIARPVRKKNLVALVDAFGQNAALRSRANLVIVGGVREDLDELEPECREVWRELLAKIDQYDLYGSVAYPKTHSPDDIPAIYALAKMRHGIFVNPALNEPFGLTLLEASAAGLPVVATDSGGPNDIIESCGNGVLIPPRDIDRLSAAILTVLSDDRLWTQYAARGQAATDRYDWAFHLDQYLQLVRDLLAPAPPRCARPRSSLLVSDIDNTLLGNDMAVENFVRWHADTDTHVFGIATGRSFHSAQSILARAGIPLPEFIIASVGTSIHCYDRDSRSYVLDTQWRNALSANWDRDAIAAVIRDLTDIVPQSPLEQNRLKLSYFTGDRRMAQLEAEVTALLKTHNLTGNVICSHGKYLDILPPAANKGAAISYIRTRYKIAADQVFVAGDSGNDVDMLASSRKSIIVGNYTDGVGELPKLDHSYVARQTHADGILEGIRHFSQEPVL